MKFFVMGCNGMAGHMISIYLKERGHDVTGFAKQSSRFVNTVIGDATDFALLRKMVLEGEYDTVINCIGLLNQFAEQDHPMAVLLNSFLPHYLAQITENTDTQVIHLSTDCVFSGRTGGYTENALRDGETFYDRSKALGELEDDKNITLRTSIVGPDIKKSGIGLLNWFLQQKGTVDGFAGAVWTGETTLQLAKTMEEAAKRHAHGLYNMVPATSINKYELLNLFNDYIRREKIEIKRVESRRVDKSLIRTRFDDFDYIIPDYETMAKELGDWMRAHRDIYPHYDI